MDQSSVFKTEIIDYSIKAVGYKSLQKLFNTKFLIN